MNINNNNNVQNNSISNLNSLVSNETVQYSLLINDIERYRGPNKEFSTIDWISNYNDLSINDIHDKDNSLKLYFRVAYVYQSGDGKKASLSDYSDAVSAIL